MTALVPRATPAVPDYGIADWEVRDVTTARLIDSMPANTQRAYRWAWDGFADWCAATGRVPLPATRHTLAEYVSHLMDLDQAPATIEQAIGVIRSMHAMAQHDGQPVTVEALKLLRLHKRNYAEAGRGQRQALPFTPSTLRQTVTALELSTLRGRRDQLLLVLGFTMMARRSELAGLHLSDVAETTDGLDVTIRTSKTDKQSEGRVCSLPPQSHPDLDPVRLHHRWRDDLADRDVVHGPLLYRVNRGGNLAGALAGAGVNDIVRDAVRRAELPEADRYTAHSLRAGGLTAALRNGVPLGIAARHGGWNPESPVAARYARAADRWRDNAMAGVL